MTQKQIDHRPADRVLWLDFDTRGRKHGTLIQRVEVHMEGYSPETIHDITPYASWDIRGDDGRLYMIAETSIRPLLERETKAERRAAAVLH